MTSIREKLFTHFEKSAENFRIEQVIAGLKYTAVTVRRGTELQAGVAYTWYSGRCCSGEDVYGNYENGPASKLLSELASSNTLEVSKALALVNALNMERAAAFPEDTSVRTIAETIKAGPGRKIVMVGFFRPIVKQLRQLGADLYIADINQGIGSSKELYERLGNWAEGAIITSTSIIGGTYDEIMAAKGEQVPAVLLGPTTPMVPEIFTEYGLDLLAGTVPTEIDTVLSIIRQGGGTRDFQKFGKKVIYAL